MVKKSKISNIFTYSLLAGLILSFALGIFIIKIDVIYISKYLFEHIINGTFIYPKFDTSGIATQILFNSLVGLGIIITIMGLILEKVIEKKVNFISRKIIHLWIISTISFIYSILFSIIKLLIWGIGDQETKVPNLAFFWFVLGIFFIIVWFISISIEVLSNIGEKKN